MTLIQAGVDSFALYEVEATFGVMPDMSSGSVHFGIVQSFGPSNKNNLIEVRGFKGLASSAGRDAFKLLGGKIETSIAIEFQPQHFDWLQYVLGSRTGAGTTGSPYVYSGSDSLSSITICNSQEQGSPDRAWYYLGCKINSMTLSATIGEPVKVSLDIIAADIYPGTTKLTNVNLDTSDVYSFHGCSMEYPNATKVTNIIESFEISIGNNIEVLYGLGSRVGKNALEKNRDYGIKFTFKQDGNTYSDDFLGAHTGTTDGAVASKLTDSGAAFTDDLVGAKIINFTDRATATVTAVDSGTVLSLSANVIGTGKAYKVEGATPDSIATVEFNLVSDTAYRYADFLFTTCKIDEYGNKEDLLEVVPEEITMKALTLAVTERQSNA